MNKQKRKNQNKYRKAKFMGILAGCVMFVWVGCEDFLTPSPESFTSTGDYFDQPSHFEAGVNSAYARLRAQAGVQDGNFRLITEQRFDAINRQFDINLPGVNEQPFQEWFAVPSNSVPRGQWNEIFNTIAQTNIVLDRLDDIEWADATQRNQIEAQAKFIRAFSYYFGVQMFGDFPIVTEEQTTPEIAIDKVRSPVSEVLNNLIIPDLVFAAQNLPAVWSDPGRATSGAALTLLGKTYLLSGDYDLAIDALEDVVGQYSLLDSYTSIFDPGNTNNEESIFELQFGPNITGQPQAISPAILVPLHARGEIVDNIINPSNNGMYPSFEVLEFYEDGDERFEEGLVPFDDPENSGFPEVAHGPENTIYLLNKYLWPNYINAQGEMEGNIILLRYADVLLSLAEAHWRNGDGAALALPYVNEVRARSGLGPVVLPTVFNSFMLEGTDLENDDLGRAIFNERTVEFLAEGHRMFDLLRFGVAYDVAAAQAESRKTREPRISGVYNIDPHEILLPIHPQEIAASNGQITQNPGW
ncbi:MAG: RagB/SusD family nutrient uptake outer membrane protein [Balneolaceae bacterium]